MKKVRSLKKSYRLLDVVCSECVFTCIFVSEIGSSAQFCCCCLLIVLVFWLRS